MNKRIAIWLIGTCSAAAFAATPATTTSASPVAEPAKAHAKVDSKSAMQHAAKANTERKKADVVK
jgi:hypothetical protein